MEQDLYYSLRFNLNESSENLGNLFSSINFFAELYSRLDHLLISSLPLSLNFSRTLKDFGENSFLFVFRDCILYPEQFPLGHQPAFADVEMWMTESRKLFSGVFSRDFTSNAHDLKNRLAELAERLKFDELLSYRTLDTGDLENIILDFVNARKLLDSEKGIILFE